MRGNGIWRFLSGVALFGLAFGLVLVPPRAASKSPQSANSPQPAADEPVPAFHAQAPQGELPETMDPELFSQPIVQNAYAVAAKIKKALYQQPCYCHCDIRSFCRQSNSSAVEMMHHGELISEVSCHGAM